MREQSLMLAADDVELEAVLHLPDGVLPFAGAVVCHPHPQYGGTMDNTVVLTLCRALTERGLAALRFNFRGVGRSSGGFDNGGGEARDAAAALAYLAGIDSVDSERVGLAGYSFGAVAALAATAQVRPTTPPKALALVSPPLQALNRESLAGVDGALLLVAGDADHICPAEGLRALVATLTRPVEAEVVPGADHFWIGYETDLDAVAGPFFARTLLSGGDE